MVEEVIDGLAAERREAAVKGWSVSTWYVILVHSHVQCRLWECLLIDVIVTAAHDRIAWHSVAQRKHSVAQRSTA